MPGSTLQLAPDDVRGRTLGKYEMLCRLSMGGMAEIFLAAQHGLAGFRKLVVLKQILPDIRGEEEFVRMFLNEARITAAFNHPNIAQVFDLDVISGELFLAMEFVPGATLVDVAKACRANSEPIPVGFALAAVRDTALALHYAHTFVDPLGRPTSVIHRDVAEKNIMVTYEGVTKLLDFGIAKNLATASRTHVGTVKGTSGYMSPEQILGEPLDARSDLFSLGVVLHECLTGLRLFYGKSTEAGMTAALNTDVPPPSRMNKAVPPALDAIVLKALSRPRDERYETLLEFARALEREVGDRIWHTEECGALIQRLFADRREQSRELLASVQPNGSEFTGEIRLAPLFAGTFPPPSGPLPPPLPEPLDSANPRTASPPLSPLPRRRDTPPPEPGTRETVVSRPPARPRPPSQETALLPRRATPAPDAKAPLVRPPLLRSALPPEPPTVGASALIALPSEPPTIRRDPAELDALWNELAPPEMITNTQRPRPPRELGRETVTSQQGGDYSDTTAPAFHPERSRGGWRVGLGLLGLFMGIAAGAFWYFGLEVLMAPLATVMGASRVHEPAKPPASPLALASIVPVGSPLPSEGGLVSMAPPPPAPAPSEETPAPVALVVKPPPKPVQVKKASPGARREKARAGLAANRRKAAKPPPPAKRGALTLVTEPYATVYLGRQAFGATPLFEVALPAGRHTLKLVSPEGKTLTLPVNIVAGDTTSMRVPLRSLAGE